MEEKRIGNINRNIEHIEETNYKKFYSKYNEKNNNSLKLFIYKKLKSQTNLEMSIRPSKVFQIKMFNWHHNGNNTVKLASCFMGS